MPWGSGFGQPGQRETIASGREQDVRTPFWQVALLIFLLLWALFWFYALALVWGSLIGYLAAGLFILWRVDQTIKKVTPSVIQSFLDAFSAAVAVWFALQLARLFLPPLLVAVVMDAIWTDYILPWSAWAKFVWLLFCAACIAPAASGAVIVWYKHIDPSYPSPRNAIDRTAPVMPWSREPDGKPESLTEERINEPRLLKVEIQSRDPNYYSGTLDLPPVAEWYRFLMHVLRHPDRFSEPWAKTYGVKIDLKSDKPPWYGRGFRQVRDDLFARVWAQWTDDANHNAGIELFTEALTAFHRYLSEGPPAPQVGGVGSRARKAGK